MRCRADPAANAALRDVLGNADGYFHSIVRAAAVTALARSLPPTGLHPVLEAVRDLDADVSMAALSAIGEHAPSLLLGHALIVLRDRSGYYLPPVRLAAARTLEQNGLLSAELAGELQPAEQDPVLLAVLERVPR